MSVCFGRYPYQGGDEEGSITDSPECLKRAAPSSGRREAELSYTKYKVSPHCWLMSELQRTTNRFAMEYVIIIRLATFVGGAPYAHMQL